MKHDLGPQNNQGNPSSSTKVKGLIQVMFSQSSALHSSDLVHKADLVHLIS